MKPNIDVSLSDETRTAVWDFVVTVHQFLSAPFNVLERESLVTAVDKLKESAPKNICDEAVAYNNWVESSDDSVDSEEFNVSVLSGFKRSVFEAVYAVTGLLNAESLYEINEAVNGWGKAQEWLFLYTFGPAWRNWTSNPMLDDNFNVEDEYQIHRTRFGL